MSNLEPSNKWHHKESEKTGLSRWLSGRESACDAGDAICLIPGSEDPLEEGMATHSSILALGNPLDRGAWRATVHRVSQSQT